MRGAEASPGPRLLVTHERAGALLVLTLNRPKANILDGATLTLIDAALMAHGDAPELRGILFEASGNHFSFGASVEEHRAEAAASMLEQFHGVYRHLGELSVPTLAVVKGACLGGGLELASYASFLFAGPRATFGQPEIKLAVFPPMASVILPWRLGGAHALDLCVSGRTVDVEAAKAMGLVHTVSEDPAQAARAFFDEHLLSASASSLRFAERAARRALSERLARDLPALERLYLEELMKTHDANEGIAAFLEKRAPVYEHRTPKETP